MSFKKAQKYFFLPSFYFIFLFDIIPTVSFNKHFQSKHFLELPHTITVSKLALNGQKIFQTSA